MLSAYDLEDKFLISLLNNEADKASLYSTVERYNRIASSEFTLYSLEKLPQWADGEFIDTSRPIRELRTLDGEPVHGRVITLPNKTKAVLMFETNRFVQATAHVFSIAKFVIVGCVILLILGIYYSYKIFFNITKPITNFSKFVSKNDDLKIYHVNDEKKIITEFQTLIEGYNESIQQQRNLIARENQLNKDISHELRTPLAIIHGASEVLQNANDDEHNKAALERILRVSGEMQDLVNGILWLSKPLTQDEMSKYRCDIEAVVHKAKNKCVENTGALAENITLKIEASCRILLPPEVLHVILRNLIANAVAYSQDKRADIQLSDGFLTISNSSSELTTNNESSFGVGLTIVNRLCKKFDIQTEYVSCDSETIFILDFNKLVVKYTNKIT